MTGENVFFFKYLKHCSRETTTTRERTVMDAQIISIMSIYRNMAIFIMIFTMQNTNVINNQKYEKKKI